MDLLPLDQLHRVHVVWIGRLVDDARDRLARIRR